MYPQDNFRIADSDTGRNKGEEKAIWASVGAVDTINKSIYGFRRVWKFPNQITPIPSALTHDVQYIWLTLDVTEEAEFRRKVRHLLK